MLLFAAVAAATHLFVSLAQTLLHRFLGHHPMGGRFFRNHINFHHAYYSKGKLVSKTYFREEGNNTPFFLIPVCLIGAGSYFILPTDIFVVEIIACAASFYAHVLFDREYHVEGSPLLRFTGFKRMQELHFNHHRHADRNFAVIDFFWDRILGSYEGILPKSHVILIHRMNPTVPFGRDPTPEISRRTKGNRL
jgi:hypothetical protein